MKKPIVCAYYFPNWHPDPRNDKWHGTGWTEWEVTKCARPRFVGHQQPKVPHWGYEDESDPKVMAKKIDAAVSHGIDGFIFDWYWFSDGGFRLKCLDHGFIDAVHPKDMKFAVMWANHDPICVHPGSRMYPKPSLLDGATSPETFLAATEHCINNYFKHPNHLRIKDALYFSIYDFDRMVKNLGGKDGAKAIFKAFRDRVAKAGLGELHLNAITSAWRKPEDYAVFDGLDVDSLGSYNWAHMMDKFPTNDYDEAEKFNTASYETLTKLCKAPYNPNVTMGWDVSPRSVQSEIYENVGYPYTGIMYGTPAQFENAIRNARDFVLSKKATGDMITLNAWNEWTEGSYLEPDEIHGMGYLEAIRTVFKDGR
jgi:hypothetical protein